MTREQQLEKALKEALEELRTAVEFIGGEGYFTLAKQILNHEIPKWEAVLKHD
jgi:hypothetical protein